VREQIDGAPIKRGRRDDVVAATKQRCDRQMHRGHSACGTDRADAAFQRCEPFLQHRYGRIGDARVDMADALKVEQRSGVLGILKGIGRRLIDRYRASPGCRVWVLPGMETQSFKRGWLRRRHD
jgi:hypothetical protein